MRVVLLSAPVGESHVAMARAIAAQLDAAETEIFNDFAVLGRTLGSRLARGYEHHLGEVQWTYNLAYGLLTRVRPARRAAELALGRLGVEPLCAALAPRRPDVVVSTHPVFNAVLAAARGAGRLPCPALGVVGPLGGLEFWTAPGLDRYLLNYAEALAAVERAVGLGRAVAIRPLVREEFFAPPSRAQQGLGGSGQLVLISGGGWGAGDLDGAVGAALSLPGVRVIAVTGRNAAARRRLGGTADDRLTVLGFTERMPELLSAADAFVAATAGISCLEARLCGCPTVCYGFPAAHVRDNTRALAAHGLARVARRLDELPGALAAALAAGRPEPDRALAARPSAADVISGLLRGRASARSAPS